MPDPPELYRMFLGEHGWSPASRYFQQPYFGDAGWTQPGENCPVEIRSTAVEYVQEFSGSDRSVDEGFRLALPATELLSGLGLRWTGNGADYINPTGQLTVFDPTAHASGPSAMLFRQDALLEFLRRERLTVCWAVLGEKRILGAEDRRKRHSSLHMSGAYRLVDGKPIGFLNVFLEDWNRKDPDRSAKLIGTIH